MNGSLVVSIRNDAEQVKPLKCILSSMGLMQKGEMKSYPFYIILSPPIYFSGIFIFISAGAGCTDCILDVWVITLCPEVIYKDEST